MDDVIVKSTNPLGRVVSSCISLKTSVRWLWDFSDIFSNAAPQLRRKNPHIAKNKHLAKTFIF
jgi:hypothetical protein